MADQACAHALTAASASFALFVTALGTEAVTGALVGVVADAGAAGALAGMDDAVAVVITGARPLLTTGPGSEGTGFAATGAAAGGALLAK